MVLFYIEQCSNTLFYIAESLSKESSLKIFPKMDEC